MRLSLVVGMTGTVTLALPLVLAAWLQQPPPITTTAQRPVATAVIADRSSPPASVAPSTTVAPTTTTTAPAPAWDPADRAPGWEQRLGDAALALVDFDPAAVGYDVRFGPGRPGQLGMTYPARHLIEVWVRPEMGVADIAAVVAHELGHAVDVTWNTPERRLRYLALRRLPGELATWFTCDACSDFATPAGDFAEVFAWRVLGGTGRFRSELAPPPSPADLDQLEPLFHP